jgi:argininosuccinate lyase
MWEGRFSAPTDPEFEAWQRSFPFDWRLLRHELAASRAHALALRGAGIFTEAECAAVRAVLDEIDAEHGQAHEPKDDGAEDVHHFVERRLVEAVGDLGLKLHTGRSRNEQIATDLRLYLRDAIGELEVLLGAWALALVEQAKAHARDVMPSYTHLQRAEPVLVAHWLLAYVEMALRDISRLQDCGRRMNLCPLGSGAVAGATLALDRNVTADALLFDAPTANSMDATSDRDFVVEFLQALSLVGLHISRFAEEMTLFATTEFGFVQLPEAYSTGSSAMPQKKNPDVTEMLRGKCGRVHASVTAVTMQLKGLPMAYNKDLQEMQMPLFTAVEETRAMLPLLARFTSAVTFNTERMRSACESGYLNAMAAATYLTGKGVPFRTAHSIVGNAVRLGIERGCELDALPLAELRTLSAAFGEDFYAAITLQATLDCHDVVGGTATHRVAEALVNAEDRVRTALANATAGDVHACA